VNKTAARSEGKNAQGSPESGGTGRLAVAILILLVAGWSRIAAGALRGERTAGRDTYAVLEGLQGLLAATQSVESSARGFALSGAQADLQSFEVGVSRSRRTRTACASC